MGEGTVFATPGCSLYREPPRQVWSLRVNSRNMAVAAALGLPALPSPLASSPSRFGDCLWTRPDEWLLSSTGPIEVESIARGIQEADAALVDLSASYVTRVLSGARSEDCLASCCALDLHPSVVKPGFCASTLVASAPVLLHLVDATPSWRIYMRPSYAAYVDSWLADWAAGEAV